MTKRVAKKKAAPPPRKKRFLRIPLTEEEYAQFEEKASTTRHENAVEFGRSVVLKASGVKNESRGEPGSRTQPNTSVPSAEYKAAAAPKRPVTDRDIAVTLGRFAKRKTTRNRGKFTHNFAGLLDVLKNESDRGCVIVGVSMIDDMLSGVLMSFIAKRCLSANKTFDTDAAKQQGVNERNESLKVLLCEQNPPLGSMFAKTEACFCFGLIDYRIRSLLGVLRQLRNDAAHFAGDFSLATSGVSGDLISHFTLDEVTAFGLLFGRNHKPYPGGFSREISARKCVEVTCLWVYGLLLNIGQDVDKASEIIAKDTRLKDLLAAC